MITILGATGQVGHRTAHFLLDAGFRVRAIGRTPDRLSALHDRGADVVVAAITPDLAGVFEGSDAVFVMLPSNPYTADFGAEQDRLGSAIVDALATSCVPRVVALSSLGADRADAPGVIGCLAAQERRLRSLPGRAVHLLRPASFFENFLPAIDQLTATGCHVDSVDADLPIPMIATTDIATAATHALTGPAWTGIRTQELLGHRDISYNEVTRILGRTFGLPAAEYERSTDADMVAFLTDSGLSRSYADLYVAMTRAFHTGELTSDTPRTAANTTETTFERFAERLVGSTASS